MEVDRFEIVTTLMSAKNLFVSLTFLGHVVKKVILTGTYIVLIFDRADVFELQTFEHLISVLHDVMSVATMQKPAEILLISKWRFYE